MGSARDWKAPAPGERRFRTGRPRLRGARGVPEVPASLLAFSADAARAAGLTPQQHQALLAIRGFAPAGGMTINDLAEQLLLKPQTAVELVDRLEEAGLVERKRAAEDRRRVLLTLTARAEMALAPLSKAHLAQIGRDARQLIELLERMSEYARGGAPPA